MLLVGVCVCVAGKRCFMKLNNSGKNFGAKCLLKVTRTATVVDKYLYYFAFLSADVCVSVYVSFPDPLLTFSLSLLVFIVQMYSLYIPLRLFYYYFSPFSFFFSAFQMDWVTWPCNFQTPAQSFCQPTNREELCLLASMYAACCAVLLLLFIHFSI